MANKLFSFFDKFSIFNTAQFGFRPGKSTTEALIHLLKIIYESLNTKKSLINIQIDLRKAFDVVRHDILLDKLFHYGIRGVTLNWFRNYLFNRQHYVGIKNSASSLKPITIGVPQGSILGPILFLIFINDMPNCSEFFSSTLFADDSTFSTSVENLTDSIQSINTELIKIQNWTLSNRLTINVEKTEMMCFTKKPIEVNDGLVFLSGEALRFSDNCTFLGVKLDTNLTFKNHVSHIMNKLSKNTGILYRIKNNLTTEARLNYYHSLLLPYMSFNVIVWGSTFKTYLEPLVLQQKRIVRIIADAHYLEHTNPLFFKFKLLKFYDIYKFFVSIYMFNKIKSGAYMVKHSVNTRSRGMAQPVFQRLTTTQHSIDFCGPKVWNELPLHIRNIEKLHTFKKQLKQHLIDQYIS